MGLDAFVPFWLDALVLEVCLVMVLYFGKPAYMLLGWLAFFFVKLAYKLV